MLSATILTLMFKLALAEGPLPPWAMHYIEIAQAIDVAARETPLPGADGEHRMAAVLTAIAYRESRFRPDAVGDHGQSVGPWQTSRAWVPPSADLNGQARLAARLVVTSFRVCASAPLEDRLGWYAAGGVGCRGLAASRNRMSLAKRLAASLTRLTAADVREAIPRGDRGF